MSAVSDKLNKILRGERAATETYEQAINKFSSHPQAMLLREMQVDHFDAVSQLKKHVEMEGQSANSESGVWGSFAKAVMGSASAFSAKAALKALKEGEEHGLKQYQDVITEQELDDSARRYISETVIPRQKQHIDKISTIMAMTG